MEGLTHGEINGPSGIAGYRTNGGFLITRGLMIAVRQQPGLRAAHFRLPPSGSSGQGLPGFSEVALSRFSLAKLASGRIWSI